ncbi:MAG: hypothetical protein NXY57DRAFT_959925 [Lentinula lateritia]|nr:MAG: hypothetical protein NXY57DRAFT_959925 [Lentinula lateritia]
MSKLARKILDEFLGIDDPANWKAFTVSADELGSYLADPPAYILPVSPMRLDTSLHTAAGMQDSPWNQMVVGLLAGQAAEHASPNPDYYGTHE